MQTIFYFVWGLLLMILQPTLARGIALWEIAPNFVLCSVVLIGFLRGRKEGAICGMVYGLLYDILIGRMIGVHSLCYLYLGFGAGWLSEGFFSGGKRLGAMLGAGIGTILCALIYDLACWMAGNPIGWITMMFRIALPEAIYNFGICFLVSFPMVGAMKLFRMARIS